MLTVSQIIRSMEFRKALGLPPEGIATPRCPRDDERTFPLPPPPEQKGGPTVDMSTFEEYEDPSTGELLFRQREK